MMDEKLSIIIPIRAWRAPPNAVEACLRSLIYNSGQTNEVIVVRDRFRVDDDTMELDKWFKSHDEWLKKYDIKIVDCPRTDKLKNEEIGAYIAGNYGAELADNDWILLYSDCDFYYHTNWDINMMNIIEKLLKEDDDAILKYAFNPTMVRMVPTIDFYEVLERGGVIKPEELTANDIAKLGGTIYFDTKSGNVKESDMLRFGDRVLVPDQYTMDPCGVRIKTGYFPNIIHKDFFYKIAKLGEDPSPAHQGDLQYDVILAGLGKTRVTVLGSIVFHTYKEPVDFDVSEK